MNFTSKLKPVLIISIILRKYIFTLSDSHGRFRQDFVNRLRARGGCRLILTCSSIHQRRPIGSILQIAMCEPGRTVIRNCGSWIYNNLIINVNDIEQWNIKIQKYYYFHQHESHNNLLFWFFQMIFPIVLDYLGPWRCPR